MVCLWNFEADLMCSLKLGFSTLDTRHRNHFAPAALTTRPNYPYHHPPRNFLSHDGVRTYRNRRLPRPLVSYLSPSFAINPYLIVGSGSVASCKLLSTVIYRNSGSHKTLESQRPHTSESPYYRQLLLLPSPTKAIASTKRSAHILQYFYPQFIRRTSYAPPEIAPIKARSGGNHR